MKLVMTSAAVCAVLVLCLETGFAQRTPARRPSGDAAGRAVAQRDPQQPASSRTPAGRAASQTSSGARRVPPRAGGQRVAVVRARATAGSDLRAWDAYVTDRLQSGALRHRAIDRDPAFPFRTIERLQEYHQGIPVWGSELVRETEAGVPRAIFGETSATDLTLDTTPRLTPEDVRLRVSSRFADATILGAIELMILRRDGAEPRLVYTAVVAGEGVRRVLVDAMTGAELMRYSEIHAQAAVGTGRGVLGDLKKLSVLRQGNVYLADDQHRPPVLTTFDFRGNLSRAISVVENGSALFSTDIASDADNDWTDPATVDAHAHVGWTYDYFFKRFGRRGLDDRDRPIVVLTNAVSQQGALSLSSAQLVWALNAFWCSMCGPGGVGAIFFGNGIPFNTFAVATGRNYTFLAGALDVAAHEFAHGIIDSSSRLIYQNESGALNEAFSDIMGTSVEFFYHRPGVGPGLADYVIAEDVARARVAGVVDGERSMADPRAHGDPDHYVNRFTLPDDNGGVHINSNIPSHAFYLAIEGGTNRTSLVAVQGVGSANREQIERVFYRAFVFLLPASATFSTARAATIQAARDLYGIGSAPERAVSQAWTAVGVF